MKKSGMFCECERRGDLRMLIVSPDTVPTVRYEAVLAIQRSESCGLCDGEKNGLRRLRWSPSELLRPQDASDSGSLLWGHPRLSGSGNPACLVQALGFGEARATFLDFGQSLLHQAVCVFCREALPCLHCSRGGKGVGAELEDGQGVGQAVYARTTQACWDAGAGGDWD